MTAMPPFSGPPFGADTDEAVSALLDGELAAFAADHGTTEADARARLGAWTGFDERRTALAGAGATAGTPVPALDDVTRHRLLRNARDEHPAPAKGPRGGRVWKVVGAAAAALVVVVGIGLAIDAASDGGRSSRDSASSAGSVALGLHGDIGDVGDLSAPDALRALLAGKRTATTAPKPADNADRSSCATCSTSEQSGGAPAPAPGGEAAARSATPPLGPTECAARLAAKRPVTFVGTGTYRGTPVTVVGLTGGDRVIAFVVPSNDCTNVLTSVSR
jgi:hypothetical protein